MLCLAICAEQNRNYKNLRMIRLFIILRKQLFLILGEITKTNLKKRKLQKGTAMVIQIHFCIFRLFQTEVQAM